MVGRALPDDVAAGLRADLIRALDRQVAEDLASRGATDDTSTVSSATAAGVTYDSLREMMGRVGPPARAAYYLRGTVAEVMAAVGRADAPERPPGIPYVPDLYGLEVVQFHEFVLIADRRSLREAFDRGEHALLASLRYCGGRLPPSLPIPLSFTESIP